MQDPLRLSESDDTIRSMVVANQLEQAPNALTAQVLASLAPGLGGVTAASGGGAMGAATPSGLAAKLSAATAKGLAVKSLSGALLLGVAGYGAAGVMGNDPAPSTAETTHSPAEKPALQQTNPAARPVPPAPTENRVAAPEVIDVEALPVLPRALPRRAAPAKYPAAAKSTASAHPSTLGQELQLVKRARSELKRGDLARARSTLSEYRQLFPEGKLHPEADELARRVQSEPKSAPSGDTKDERL